MTARIGGCWRSLLSDAGSAAGVVIPVEGACFVDAGLISLGSGGRIEIKLDLAAVWFCTWFAADILPGRPRSGAHLWPLGRHAQVATSMYSKHVDKELDEEIEEMGDCTNL